MLDPIETVDPASLGQWLQGRSFADWQAQFDDDGYVVFDGVLGARDVRRYRDALAPHLAADVTGRNDFEGLRSNRVYALLAKEPVFGDMVTHPLPLAFAEADLGASCLLSALLAINLHPGESTQPWHNDDGHIAIPLPRPSYGVSAFWALDDLTDTNGATKILPGSHRWSGEEIAGKISSADFRTILDRDEDDDPAAHPGARKVTMPAGSLMLAKGTLWHRGGANRSARTRLIVTPQYCPGWVRQLENMMAAVPPAQAATLPERARELLGYSIHPPFMGHVGGRHPEKRLAEILGS